MPRIGFESWTASTGVIDGKPHVVFGGCNYLGLAHHPGVHHAVTQGLARWGLTTTASRETTGNTKAHESLEREIAAFMGMPAAILTTEGYTANIALGQGLAADHSIAVLDEKSHSSVVLGMTASGLKVEYYRHLDAAHAIEVAHRHAGGHSDSKGVVVMTDGVFAADGGVAPAGAILAGLPAKGVTFVLDDCHGFTVLGEKGRGLIERDRLAADPRVVLTTTFAKGLGCYGGAIVGRRALIDTIMQRSLVYRGTTPCPPPVVEGAREALRIIDREPERLAQLRDNVRHMRRLLAHTINWRPPEPMDALVPIFVFWLDPASEMHRVQKALSDAGFFVPLIDYPGGPTPWYFRATVTAGHTAEQIERFGEALRAAVAPAGAGTQVSNPRVAQATTATSH
ncbi:MAG: pyridoxal phosphate-dependent aminotransferase family protein [Planctomycetota bacterium]